MTTEHVDRIQGLKSLIGNTPLLEVRLRYRGEDRTAYAKAEHLNMTGSIKDRMAFHIISRAYESGDLKPGGRLIEVTSGNTGIAFSAIGRALGHPATIFMPDWMSPERINLMKALGAEIVLVSKSGGGFLGSIERADEMCAACENAFLPHQFSNEANTEAHYLTTGPEIWWQLCFRGFAPDAFVAGVGTGGTIMGVGNYLRERVATVKLFPLEPASSPTLSTGCKIGSHRIQGISDEFIPPILHLDEVDGIINVDDGDAILMAQNLGSQLGLAVGISSGANLIGALKVQDALGIDSVVVTVFSDDNKKYLSTDLLRFERCGRTTSRRTCASSPSERSNVSAQRAAILKRASRSRRWTRCSSRSFDTVRDGSNSSAASRKSGRLKARMTGEPSQPAHCRS